MQHKVSPVEGVCCYRIAAGVFHSDGQPPPNPQLSLKPGKTEHIPPQWDPSSLDRSGKKGIHHRRLAPRTRNKEGFHRGDVYFLLPCKASHLSVVLACGCACVHARVYSLTRHCHQQHAPSSGPLCLALVASKAGDETDEPGSPKLVAQSSVVDLPVEDVCEYLSACP